MSELNYHCNLFDVAECSRCKADLTTLMKASLPDMTVGYYVVKSGDWAKFANEGERYLCDACMWKDLRYIAVYGKAI